MSTNWNRVLGDLSRIPAPAGTEEAAARYIKELLKPMASQITIDPLGNVKALIKGTGVGPRILLDAHMDEIALMVTKIEEGGFLRVCPIGGVDARVLSASHVIVHGKVDLPGTIASKPPHIQSPDESRLVTEIKDLCIDVGLSQERCRELVSVGDLVTFDTPFNELMGGKVSGKSLDDRAGLVAVLWGAQMAVEGGAAADIEIMASVQEEVGLRGARTGAFFSEADCCLVVDVSHAKTPDCSDERTFDMGGGVLIGVGPSFNKEVTNGLFAAAKKEGIAVVTEVAAGDSGTNAWAIEVSNAGLPCGLLSIPMRYMHTPVETVNIKDVEGAARLIAAYILSLGEGVKI